MMRILEFDALTPQEFLNRDIQAEEDVSAAVDEILAEVRRNGDAALREYTKRFNGVELDNLRVTQEEFDAFIECVKDKPLSYYAFRTMFWTGVRVGELLALTLKDFNAEERTLSITKSYQRIEGRDVITEPKTQNSKFCWGGKENDVSEAFPSCGQPWSLDSLSLFQACFNFQPKLLPSRSPSSPGSGELAA